MKNKLLMILVLLSMMLSCKFTRNTLESNHLLGYWYSIDQTPIKSSSLEFRKDSVLICRFRVDTVLFYKFNLIKNKLILSNFLEKKEWVILKKNKSKITFLTSEGRVYSYIRKLN